MTKSEFISINVFESKAVVRIKSSYFSKPQRITLVTDQPYSAYYRGSYKFGKIPFYAFFYKDTIKIKFPNTNLSFTVPRKKVRCKGTLTIEKEYTKGILQTISEVRNIVKKIGIDKISRGDSDLYKLYKDKLSDQIKELK